MRRECRESFSRHRFQTNALVSDTGMHHGDACRDRQPAVAGITFPVFPAHEKPAILRFWQEAHDGNFPLVHKWKNGVENENSLFVLSFYDFTMHFIITISHVYCHKDKKALHTWHNDDSRKLNSRIVFVNSEFSTTNIHNDVTVMSNGRDVTASEICKEDRSN